MSDPQGSPARADEACEDAPEDEPALDVGDARLRRVDTVHRAPEARVAQTVAPASTTRRRRVPQEFSAQDPRAKPAAPPGPEKRPTSDAIPPPPPISETALPRVPPPPRLGPALRALVAKELLALALADAHAEQAPPSDDAGRARPANTRSTWAPRGGARDEVDPAAGSRDR